jgi:hypothetical protein
LIYNLVMFLSMCLHFSSRDARFSGPALRVGAGAAVRAVPVHLVVLQVVVLHLRAVSIGSCIEPALRSRLSLLASILVDSSLDLPVFLLACGSDALQDLTHRFIVRSEATWSRWGLLTPMTLGQINENTLLITII